MNTEPLSEDEQDAIVTELAVNITDLSEEEFEHLYRQLDVAHQIRVDINVREFADNAVGDEHWTLTTERRSGTRPRESWSAACGQ